ncbi:hypothetical protein HMPREF1039_1464 [Megasphaera lornae]|uniref:DUF4446 family protein n=1 Tax=Megasphaera lornae TaxID=1000568 RepID=A0ABP2L8W8_9FIRM|nr:DUF4446 family protein [Megasphaera lornae]EGL42218.1 hypothetical protein HMPREF1039_1464 [Megasphaera lornae]
MFFGLNLPGVEVVMAGAACIILILLLVCIISLHIRLNRVTRQYTFFMQDATGESVERKLREDVAKLHQVQELLANVRSEQQVLLQVQQHCFQKIGFVKYNAFENIGNKLSFAFTVLDGKNDGFCLSSVYGRNESRIFAKEIRNGHCLYSMSMEEQDSLEQALQDTGESREEPSRE